jgi:hypothetical protein
VLGAVHQIGECGMTKMRWVTLAVVCLCLSFSQANAFGYGLDQNELPQNKPPFEDLSEFYRVDCRYHNIEELKEIKHCYASAIYRPHERGYSQVQMGVGCDSQTIYNDRARVHIEEVGERISPRTAAFPGIEIFPKSALSHPGTYESILDIRAGRLSGICYVHRLWDLDDDA